MSARPAWAAAVGLIGLAGVFCSAAVAAQPQDYDLRDLSVGQTAGSMPSGYYDFACGRNGGPPAELLPRGWLDYMKCPKDPMGFHEVYFTFDDEFARVARTDPDVDAELINKYSGTVVSGFPVIASVLFDDKGVVRGIRIVTDPRAPLQQRRQAYLLHFAVERRYGEAGWDCTDLPPLPRETKIGDDFIKNHCEKSIPDRLITTEARFYRRPGQTGYIDGQYTPGEFESSGRVEIWDPSVFRK